jgi:hypothetical protein
VAPGVAPEAEAAAEEEAAPAAEEEVEEEAATTAATAVDVSSQAADTLQFREEIQHADLWKFLDMYWPAKAEQAEMILEEYTVTELVVLLQKKFGTSPKVTKVPMASEEESQQTPEDSSAARMAKGIATAAPTPSQENGAPGSAGWEERVDPLTNELYFLDLATGERLELQGAHQASKDGSFAEDRVLLGADVLEQVSDGSGDTPPPDTPPSAITPSDTPPEQEVSAADLLQTMVPSMFAELMQSATAEPLPTCSTTCTPAKTADKIANIFGGAPVDPAANIFGITLADSTPAPATNIFGGEFISIFGEEFTGSGAAEFKIAKEIYDPNLFAEEACTKRAIDLERDDSTIDLFGEHDGGEHGGEKGGESSRVLKNVESGGEVGEGTRVGKEGAAQSEERSGMTSARKLKGLYDDSDSSSDDELTAKTVAKVVALKQRRPRQPNTEESSEEAEKRDVVDLFGAEEKAAKEVEAKLKQEFERQTAKEEEKQS